MTQKTGSAMLDQTIDLAFDFAQAIVRDPTILNDIPNGVTLVLVPDDDPALAVSEIGLGIEAVRRGENVYFRHFRRTAASSWEGSAQRLSAGREDAGSGQEVS